MAEFLEQLFESEIRQRDKYQFEIKSDHAPLPHEKEYHHTTEFYFFIPAALQITPSTYTRENFYQDQTHYIRFKTPSLSLKELLNTKNEGSPIAKIAHLTDPHEICEELKLFGNMVRSNIRDRIRKQVVHIHKNPTEEIFLEVDRELEKLVREIQEIRTFFHQYPDTIPLIREIKQISETFQYIDEYFSLILDLYLTGLFQELKKQPHEFHTLGLVKKLMEEENIYRKEHHYLYLTPENQEHEKEYFVYRKGILKKFVLDVLLLSIERKQVLQQYSNYIGAFAAGIAMLIYILLFVWQGSKFVINSAPFVILTVVFYILKDRVKEALKVLFQKQALRWFPDYTTEIFTPDRKHEIGTVAESFSYINHKSIEGKIRDLRELDFTSDADREGRIEHIFRYKQQVSLHTDLIRKGSRRFELNNIFRFNISQFLKKASDSYQDHSYFDPETEELQVVRCPKVYHVNVIMRSVVWAVDTEKQESLKRFRLIIDKDGIKRIERIF